MKYIVENWFVIVGLIAVLAAGGYAVYVFVKMPSDKQLNKAREWLLYAVTKAEKELGGGTGQIKLRYVYDMFVARFDALKKVSTACYTGNLRAALKAAGFEVLTENKYLTSDAYLLAGDILLNDGAHTATNLTDGAKSSGAGASNTTPVKSNTKVDVAYGFDKSLAGTYKVTASGLNLRAGAGTGKSILAVMENGEKAQCYGYYNDCNGVKWLYVVYKNIVGYASSKYLSK